MEKRSFYAPDIDPSALAEAVHDWLMGQGYQTQMLPSQGGSITIQARKEDALRTLSGMATALTLVVSSDGQNISAEMGNAKWTDKAVVGGVGVLLFPPALITAGIGAFQQSQLTSNAWKFIDNYVHTQSAFGSAAAVPGMPPGGGAFSAPPAQTPPPARSAPPPPLNFSAGGGTPPAAGAAGGTLVCPSCKQALRPGAKFCDNCGAPAPVSNQCRSCGKALRPGARFCDNCGSPVG